MTGSVFSQAVVTEKLCDFMVISISAVAPICAMAPIAVKAKLRPVRAGTGSFVARMARPRNKTAKGSPNKNRT